MFIWSMAWRNLWRNGRRTVVTVAAMTLALLVMLVWAAMIEGYLVQLEGNLLDIELGEMQVFAHDYRDNPSLFSTLEEAERLVEELEARQFKASARLLGGGLVAAGEASAGAQLVGVDVERDASVSGIHLHLREGSWLDDGSPHGVVIGSRLARTLAVGPGEELVVLSQAADGSIANDLYEVRGILKSISDATDRSGLFMTEGAFRDLFLLETGAHQILLRTPRGTPLESAAEEVAELESGLDVKSWRQLVPTLASLLDSTRGLSQILFFVVYIAVGILLVNAMLMAVFERIRELGVLKAVGVGPGKVLGLILVEGAIETLLAIFFGLLLAVPSLWYLHRVGLDMGKLGGFSVMGMALDPVWRAVVTPATVLGPLVSLVVIVFLSVLYPAAKAARIEPVQAIHHQ